jgi:RNA polymerase sigma-70 factor (ECF subfamily)
VAGIEPSLDEADLRALCDAQQWAEAATLIVQRYGRELLSYLVAIARDETDGSEAFSQFTEDLWRGLPRFRWQSTARTWCYALARNALFRIRRRGRRSAAAVPLSEVPELEHAAAQVRTTTLTYLRTEVKDEIAALRERLSPDDQALLILRVDRKLEWLDVARALADEDVELTDSDLARRSAALRKRFARIKAELKKLLRDRPRDRP